MEKKNDIINRAVTSLFKKNGSVTPSMLVGAAKPKMAPLHKFFEWDDKKAGHEFRLLQARRIIRIAKIEKSDGEKENFFHVPSVRRGEGEYKPASIVLEKKDDYALAIYELQIKLNAIKRSIKDLQRAAEGRGDEAMARIAVAMQAITTAREAVSTLQ